MLGIFYLVLFILFGISISYCLFNDQTLIVLVWLGIGFGLLGLMWCVVPFSFIFGFTYISHLCSLFLMFLVCFFSLKNTTKKSFYLNKFTLNSINIHNFPYTAYLIIALPILFIIIVLLNNHILLPGPDGGLYGGQSTYGDLALHLGIITGLGQQNIFPPDYTIFPGQLLSYPFLTNSLSASMYLLGTSLRSAVLIPSYLLMFLVVTGFFILTYEILKDSVGTTVACLLFFFNGGFGFIYFLDHIQHHPENFTRIFSSWYQTPTNYNEMSIRWSNVIADMLIPQRTTMGGWAILFIALWLLYKGLLEKKRAYFFYSGIIAGLLPMIHTHSYLAMGVIALSWLTFYSLIQHKNKNELLFWLYFFIPAGVLSLPQLFFWTLPQSTGGGFLRVHLNWLNTSDHWLWFWIKNVGVVFLFIPSALYAQGKKRFWLYSGAIILFLVSNLFVFQPNTYDNNKLLYIWYAFSTMIVANYLIFVYRKLKGLPGRTLLVGIVLISCTLSAFLTLGREMISGGQYLLFDSSAVNAAEFIRETTPKDALFLTSDQHLNPVSALAGRNSLAGTPIYLFFHGIDYNKRTSDIAAMFQSPDRFESLSEAYDIDYIYLSRYEREKFKVELEDFFDRFPLIFHNNDIYLFAVSDRAQERHR